MSLIIKIVTPLFFLSSLVIQAQERQEKISTKAKRLLMSHRFDSLDILLKPYLTGLAFVGTKNETKEQEDVLIYYLKSLSIREKQSETLKMVALTRKKPAASNSHRTSLILDFYEASALIVLQQYSQGRQLYKKVIDNKQHLLPTLDSLIIKSHANIAVSYHMEGRWREAEQHYQETFSILSKNPNQNNYNETRAYLSANYLNLLFDVLRRYHQADAFLSEVMAQPFNKEIRPANDHLFLIAADYYRAVGEKTKFLETAEMLEKYFTQQRPFRDADLGYIYLAKAHHYSTAGNITKSILYARMSEELVKKEEGQFNYLPEIYELLSKNYTLMGDEKEAVRNTDKLIAVNDREHRYPKYLPFIIAAKNYALLGGTLLSQDYYQKGELHFNTMPHKTENDIELFNKEMALICLQQNKPEKARKHLMELSGLVLKNPHFGLTKSLEIETELAGCDLRNNNYDNALRRLDALSVHLSTLPKEIRNSSINLFGNSLLMPTINHYYAQAWLQKSNEEKDTTALDNARLHIEKATEGRQSQLASLIFDADRISNVTSISDYYTTAYSIASAIYLNNPTEAHLNALLQVSQKAKNPSLSLYLNGKTMQNQKRNSLTERNSELLAENSYLSETLKAAMRINNNDSIITLLLEKQKNILNRIDVLKKEIKSIAPQEKDIYLTTKEIQARLTPTQAVADYFIADNTCHIIVICKKNQHVVKVPWTNDDSKQLAALEDEISTPFYGLNPHRIDNFKLLSFSVYNKLIEPITQYISNCRLAVVPHKELNLIPFESLISLETTEQQFSNLNYLILRHPISYSTSLALLPDFNKKRVTVNGITAFAPDYGFRADPSISDNEGFQFSELPGATVELKKIKSTWHTRTFMGQNATKNRLTQVNPQNQILHMAMHATSDPGSPAQSALVFSNGKDRYQLLKAFEIYNMQIDVPLLTLNACNTANGRYMRGEGVLNLTRAFLFAGAGSILSTLWPISDAVSTDIIDGFYKNLKSGATKDVALQQAKIEFIKNAGSINSHPYYWAAHTLTGETNALKQKNNYLTIIIISLISTISAIMIIRKKRGSATLKADGKPL